MTNNIVAGNIASSNGSALYLQFPNLPATLIHNTVADNSGSAETIYANTGYHPINFTNTIFSGNSGTVISTTTGSTVNLESTLWYNNGAMSGGPGTVTTHNDYTGNPAYANPAANDYHLTAASAALDKGVATFVTTDIDSQTRPAGSAADLGADEFGASGPSLTAEKLAFTPQWYVTVDPQSGQQVSRYTQRYLLSAVHDNPTPLTVELEDELPAALSYVSAWQQVPMTFNQQGQTLEWETQSALASGAMAQILLTTESESVAPGDTVVNTASAQADSWNVDLTTATDVPLFPPLIIEPGTGEICRPDAGQVNVSGLAWAGATVKIYEDGVRKSDNNRRCHGYLHCQLRLLKGWIKQYNLNSQDLLRR